MLSPTKGVCVCVCGGGGGGGGGEGGCWGEGPNLNHIWVLRYWIERKWSAGTFGHYRV